MRKSGRQVLPESMGMTKMAGEIAYGVSDLQNIKSFTCKILIKGGEMYFLEPSPRMFAFFGTTSASYEEGIIKRIRQDIGVRSADLVQRSVNQKAVKGLDFRIIYPSKRGDGSACLMQMDAYAMAKRPDGHVYHVIAMDITELEEVQAQTRKLTVENAALTEDSPVGLGIYHIKDDRFDLVYTNQEYYEVHYGSREFWDKFKGRDALDRIVPADRLLINQEWQKTKANPGHIYNVTYRCLGEDKKLHWIRLLARMGPADAEGRHVCYACYLNVDREKEAEAKAERMRRNLINTISSLPSCSVLYRKRQDGRFEAESYSREFCQMMGGSEEEIRRLYTEDVFFPVHPEDRESLKLNLERNWGSRDVNTVIYRLLTKKGTYKWVNDSYAWLKVDGVDYVYSVYIDVDEVKRHEEEMKQQYLSAQNFLDSVTSTYLATLRVNLTQNQVEELYGQDPLVANYRQLTYDMVLSELLATMPREADRKNCLQKASREALLQVFKEGQKTVIYDYLSHGDDGILLWVRAKINLALRPGGQDVVAFIGMTDINKDKNLELTMNQVMTRQYDFILTIDVKHDACELVSASPEMQEDLTGLSPDIPEFYVRQFGYSETMKAYVERYVVEEEVAKCKHFMNLGRVVEALARQEEVSAIFRLCINGKILYKKLDYRYLDQESQLLSLVRSDFTKVRQEQKEQEDKLRSALKAAKQASVAKTEFLSRMSHEIRTPMNAIIGLDTIALQEKGLTSAMEDHLLKIGISARFLLSLINDILDMSRIESGKMLLKNIEFNFHGMVDNINSILYSQCRERGIDYECVINGFVEEAYVGDELKLQQVLLNMLGNAVKFTSSGGKIHFMVEQLGRDDRNARLRFTIADTGSGIDPDFLPHMFDAFSQEEGGSTTTYGGTGLGLAISKNLVRMMDGHIDVHSVKGMGTDFKVDLSLGLAEHALTWQQLKKDFLQLKLDTLIVDDDVIVCEHTKLVLEQAGLAAEWVDSGAAAVQQVVKRHEAGKDYNLVLVDWKMPDMDGVETVRRIRKVVGREVTIVILTAYDWSEIEEEAISAGVDNFIRKPVFASSVLRAYQEKHICHKKRPNFQATYHFEGQKLLLVEDNLINSEIAKRLLELVGFQVVTAGTGVEAIKIFSEAKPQEFAVILMDIRMPVMDGLEASRLIRVLSRPDARTIPIVAMSANAFEEDVQKSLDSGMNAYLTKPVEAEKLYQTLQRVLKCDFTL